MSTSKAADLRRTLESAKNQPLVILIAGSPDPDALGSALAHQRICEHLGVPATIAHAHPLSRLENRALVKLLNIEMLLISSGADLAPFRFMSLVDTNAVETGIEVPEHVELLTIVDHHRKAATPAASFVDVRLDIGASCSLYAQYLEAGIVPFGAGAREDTRVATGLLFGIMTDTDNFSLATAEDFRAAAFLKPTTDGSVLTRLAHRAVSAESMLVLGRALGNLEIVRDVAIAGVGVVSEGNRDAIGMAADHILHREDIDTVLVYGIVGKRIDGSLRTSSASIDPAQFVRGAFGSDADGNPYGGGRADKGGFQIPLGVVGELNDDEGLWKLVERLVRQRVARVLPEIKDTVG